MGSRWKRHPANSNEGHSSTHASLLLREEVLRAVIRNALPAHAPIDSFPHRGFGTKSGLGVSRYFPAFVFALSQVISVLYSVKT
jgi:hypothetical protein